MAEACGEHPGPDQLIAQTGKAGEKEEKRKHNQK